MPIYHIFTDDLVKTFSLERTLGQTDANSHKLKFHDADSDIDTDTEDRREDVGVFGDFPVQLATSTSRTRTRILADLSDTRDFPREDVR